MGNYETDSKSDNNSLEYIVSYRSGNGSVPPGAETTCDIQIKCQNPFDFTVDWRDTYVKVYYIKTYANGRKRRKYTWKHVPFPFYNFKVQKRPVKEWLHILEAGEETMKDLYSELGSEHFEEAIPEVLKRIKWLKSILEKFRNCKKLLVERPRPQHYAKHLKYVIDSPVLREHVDITWPQAMGTVPISYCSYKTSLFQPPTFALNGFTIPGPSNNGYCWDAEDRVGMLQQALYIGPFFELISTPSVGVLTAMLWPDSGDFADVASKPLIDIAEAASDATFPLGDPPDPLEAGQRMTNSLKYGTKLDALREIIDFSTNALLWKQLVVGPLYSSAVGLAASVKANDLAIDKYTSAANSGRWIQGKKLRLWGEDATRTYVNFGGHAEILPIDRSNSSWFKQQTYDIQVDKCEANAYFTYKLAPDDAVLLNTSKMRLGQFFNRLASSVDSVLHNVTTLSFVVDWFTSEYTGQLDLKDKVYMPVSDWNLTLSQHTAFDLKGVCTTMAHVTLCEYWVKESWENEYTLIDTRWLAGDLYDTFYWTYPREKLVPTGSKFLQPGHRDESNESHEIYERFVYNKPVRDTVTPPSEAIPHLEVNKSPTAGQLFTLGALIWGFL